MSIALFCSTPTGLIPESTNHCLLKVNDIRFTKYTPVAKKTIMGDSLAADISPDICSLPETSTADTTADTPFVPERLDTLYWCIYTAMYGLDAYNDSKRKEFAVEKNDKFAYMDKIQSSGGDFTSMMKARSIQPQHVMDVLMNKRRIDIPTCVAISMLCGIDLWIETERVFVRHVSGGTDVTNHTIVIRRNDSIGKYELLSDGWDESTISKYTHGIESTKFEIVDIDKPLKGFSSYSLPDLQLMAEKVGVDPVDATGKRKLKKTLYMEISTRISLPKN